MKLFDKTHTVLLSWSDNHCIDCGRFIGTRDDKKRCRECYLKNMRYIQNKHKNARFWSRLYKIQQYRSELAMNKLFGLPEVSKRSSAQEMDYKDKLRETYLNHANCVECPRHIYCESAIIGMFYNKAGKIDSPCGITFRLVYSMLLGTEVQNYG